MWPIVSAKSAASRQMCIRDSYCAQQLAGGTAWGIVCDGMGGVNGGRIAARIATDTMQQYFARHMKALQPGMEKTFIMRGFDITNRAVYEKSTSDPEMQGMGTTGVCAYASRGLAHVVHAGDSRAYLFHAGALRQITRDHSMVQQLVDSGQITREQAAIHPQKNLITRALGVSANICLLYTSQELERRLRCRGTEDEETIQRRLKRAETEIANSVNYDEHVVNVEVDSCAESLYSIIQFKLQHGSDE